MNLMKNTGRDYERFVASIQQAILAAEQCTRLRNVVVETNKKLIDSNELEREFDVYWEYEFDGVFHRTVIECKDYSSRISIEKIDALIGKLSSFSNLKGVFATKLGYQTGAMVKAEAHGIELLLVRDPNDWDWRDGDGRPLVRRIILNLHMSSPIEVKERRFDFDEDWIRNNLGLKQGDSVPIAGDNTDIYIEDIRNGVKKSVHELENQITLFHQQNKPNEVGTFDYTYDFDDAYLYASNSTIKLKIKKAFFRYSIAPPIKNEIVIDGDLFLQGVVDYLQKGIRRKVFKDGRLSDHKFNRTK